MLNGGDVNAGFAMKPTDLTRLSVMDGHRWRIDDSAKRFKPTMKKEDLGRCHVVCHFFCVRYKMHEREPNKPTGH